MILIENVEVTGLSAAIRGMRNPLDSWAKSDSGYEGNEFKVGEADLDLMRRLREAGTDHRKYLRMIAVYADITAPLYWYKEYDTYKVGTVANSCSTMHTIHKHGINEDLFSLDNGYEFNPEQKKVIEDYLALLETLRVNCKSGDETWRALIQLLPEAFNQKRTVMLNYEVLANMYKSRKTHKLNEWVKFCEWIKTLPHSELITGEI